MKKPLSGSFFISAIDRVLQTFYRVPIPVFLGCRAALLQLGLSNCKRIKSLQFNAEIRRAPKANRWNDQLTWPIMPILPARLRGAALQF
jgi:hypothetical protein